MGWPGAEAGLASHNHQRIGQDALVTPAQKAADQRTKTSPIRRTEPWAGARVEWTLDARGEEDVGYRLLPTKLPSFISVAKARSVLEAGRALRLLRRAAEPDHPLVQLLGQEQHSQHQGFALPLPSWLTSEQEYTSCRLQAQTRIRQLQQRIAAWRSGRPVAPTEPDPNESDPPHPQVGHYHDDPSVPTLAAWHHPSDPVTVPHEPMDPLTLMAQCDALPELDHPNDELDDETDPDYRDFVQWINHPSSTSQAANSTSGGTYLFGGKLAQRLLELPLLWSSLISRALISVFFRDLGLPAYLSTCRDFLLLGSAQFAEQLHNLLFSDGMDEDLPPLWNSSGTQPPGEGLSLYLAPTTAVGPTEATKRVWPPTAGQIAPRFNAAVLEAVAERRAQAVARAERAERAAERNEPRSAANKSGRTSYDMVHGTTRTDRVERRMDRRVERRVDRARDALVDLDERLSFALVDPHVSKIRGRKRSRWQDPTCTFNPCPPLPTFVQGRMYMLTGELCYSDRCTGLAHAKLYSTVADCTAANGSSAGKLPTCTQLPATDRTFEGRTTKPVRTNLQGTFGSGTRFA